MIVDGKRALAHIERVTNIRHIEGDGFDGNGNIIYDIWICPCCGEKYEVDYDDYGYRPRCGQMIDWRDFA